MSQIAIEIKNLNKQYNNILAVKNITFNINFKLISIKKHVLKIKALKDEHQEIRATAAGALAKTGTS